MGLIHSLAFGDLAADWWGVSWAPEDSDVPAHLAWRHGQAGGVLTGRLQATGQTEPWRVEGEEVSLRISPAGAVARAGAAGGELVSLDQLCTVSGKLMLEGEEREVSCLGWRARLESSVELDRIDSFRQTAGWFDTAEGFALVALRPRRARGQDADLVAAAVLEPEPAPAVADPRLSTTYDAGGRPTRAGLELWFELDESDPDGEREQLPRRAAGELVGAGIEWMVAGFSLYAVPLGWHSRGANGIGIYLLGRSG